MKHAKIGQLTTVLSGFAFKSELFGLTGGMPLIRIRDVVRGKSETNYAGPYEDRYIVQNGDMLIGMDGEFNLARWQGGPALLNQRVCKIRSSSDRLDDGYLYWYLPKALKAIEDKTPYVTVKHLSVRDLADIEIPIPFPDDPRRSLAEQKRIAAILDKADAIRRRRQEAARLADTLIPSVFYEMFGDPGTNPKRWPVKPLASICPIAGEYGSGAASTPHRSGLPRYIRITDIEADGRLRDSSVAPDCPESEWEKYVLAEGDVLFARSGATVGKTYLYSSRDGFAVFAGYLIRFRPDPRIMLPVYLYSFTRTLWYNGWIQSKQRVVAQPNINATQYGELPVPIAPIDLQQAFAKRVQEIEELIRAHLEQAKEAESLFNALVQRAFRGEL